MAQIVMPSKYMNRVDQINRLIRSDSIFPVPLLLLASQLPFSPRGNLGLHSVSRRFVHAISLEGRVK